MERVDQIRVNIRKLLHVCGIRMEGDSNSRVLDGVTSDLDVEALTKGLLELMRELDLYLQNLLNANSTEVQQLEQEVGRLEKDLEEKEELIRRSVQMMEDAQNKMSVLTAQHEVKLYGE